MESTDNPTGEPMNSRVFGVSDAGQAYLKVSFFNFFLIFLNYKNFENFCYNKNIKMCVNKN